MEEGTGVTCRRSPRLHPQNQASEVGAGVNGRRSPRLRPRNQASEVGAGVNGRRSPRLPPQIHASQEDARVTRRRRRSLPDDDDMLREILLRLPPQPSSLPRASAVCKRWRGLVTDPMFHRMFYAHHRKPPLLGVFVGSSQGIKFDPILGRCSRVPPLRLSLGRCSRRCEDYKLLNCRHGLVLVRDFVRGEVVVCDPITGEHRRVSVPPEFKSGYFTGAVLCAAGNQGHVHGSCHSSSFKVVLVFMRIKGNQPFACVYSSEVGVWSNIISTAAPCKFLDACLPATLVGNALCWLSMRDRILEFDIDRQNLAMTEGPPVTNDFLHGYRRIIQPEDGAVGFAILAHSRIQMWQRSVNCHDVATWVQWKTIEMHRITGLPPQIEGPAEVEIFILGYDEDTNVMFVSVSDSVYLVQLKSMQSKKLSKTIGINRYHPFKSFYTPGNIAGSRYMG